jgi:hypothetical protein
MCHKSCKIPGEGNHMVDMPLERQYCSRCEKYTNDTIVLGGEIYCVVCSEDKIAKHGTWTQNLSTEMIYCPECRIYDTMDYPFVPNEKYNKCDVCGRYFMEDK